MRAYIKIKTTHGTFSWIKQRRRKQRHTHIHNTIFRYLHKKKLFYSESLHLQKMPF